MRSHATAALAFTLTCCQPYPDCAEILAAGPPNNDQFHNGAHSVTILEQGFDALIQRAALLRSAQTSIDILTFIWADDVSGRFVFDECVRAARRGVRVRILIDGLYCSLNGTLIAAAVAQNPTLSVAWYNPALGDLLTGSRKSHPAIYRSLGRINQRMHTKVVLVDHRYAITGGRNFEDTYFDIHAGLNFVDRDILIEGSVTADIQASCNSFFEHQLIVDSLHLTPLTREKPESIDYAESVAHADLETLRNAIDQRLIDRGTWISAPMTANRVYYHADPPGKATAEDGLVTTRAIRYLLCAAKEEILLQSPYFVTTSSAEAFFDENEERNPPAAIRVHTNSLAATDNWATYSAYQREKRHLVHYPNLDLFEIMPRPRDIDSLWSMDPTAIALRARAGEDKAYLCLHAKSMVLDRRVAMIGSFNLDPRSANINTEVMLEIDDPAIAARVADSIERDMSPHNSWVAAKRLSALGNASINDMMARTSSSLSRYLFIDIWPIANTSLYRLKDGHEPCRHTHPQFFERYEAIGSFPESNWSSKMLSAELFRTTGAVFTSTL